MGWRWECDSVCSCCPQPTWDSSPQKATYEVPGGQRGIGRGSRGHGGAGAGVSHLLLCLQSHLSSCSVSPLFCLGLRHCEIRLPAKQGRAQRGVEAETCLFPPSLMPERDRCILGMLLLDLLLFQGTYSSRQAGIMAALVTGAGVLLAVAVFVIYWKFKGELLPLWVTVPADLASRR